MTDPSEAEADGTRQADGDDSPSSITHEHCDADALPAETTAAADLAMGAFHKICPGEHAASEAGIAVPLGRPRCGDGSSYSFLFHAPAAVPTAATGSAGGEKVLIELAGGGACWDGDTCEAQSWGLSFPSFFVDPLVGTSCSDASDAFGTLLCDRGVGSAIDFSLYNFVFVPYCTQDVHMGDNANSSHGVRHVGAHNLYRTVRWVLENFPNPSHVVLTGCSAGATPLVVAYDLINSHYSSTAAGGGRSAARIDVVADSPVFLTPPHHLRNNLPSWNVGTILGLVGFDLGAHGCDEDFPNALLDHAMRRGEDSDEVVFVTHDADEVAMFYYRMMNGTSIEDASAAVPDAAIASAWWAGTNDTIARASDGHANFHAFVMEGSGHCTFGLVSTITTFRIESCSSFLRLPPKLEKIRRHFRAERAAAVRGIRGVAIVHPVGCGILDRAADERADCRPARRGVHRAGRAADARLPSLNEPIHGYE